jgi:hypothetical protein
MPTHDGAGRWRRPRGASKPEGRCAGCTCNRRGPDLHERGPGWPCAGLRCGRPTRRPTTTGRRLRVGHRPLPDPRRPLPVIYEITEQTVTVEVIHLDGRAEATILAHRRHGEPQHARIL